MPANAAKPSGAAEGLTNRDHWRVLGGRSHAFHESLGRVLSAAVLTLLLSTTGASAAPARPVYVRVGPPAAVAEVAPCAPGPRYVWIAGYQRWNGRAYVWVPGRWAMPPRARAAWVPARWVHERRGWYFVEGHWRR